MTTCLPRCHTPHACPAAAFLHPPTYTRCLHLPPPHATPTTHHTGIYAALRISLLPALFHTPPRASTYLRYDKRAGGRSLAGRRRPDEHVANDTSANRLARILPLQTCRRLLYHLSYLAHISCGVAFNIPPAYLFCELHRSGADCGQDVGTQARYRGSAGGRRGRRR